VVLANVDVELDRIDSEGGWGVILEVDRLGLGLSHPRILGARKAAPGLAQEADCERKA
jgi:hypothetical protein